MRDEQREGVRLEDQIGFPIELFDTFPEPVFLVREGCLTYRNRAAAKQLAELRLGEPLPAALSGLAESAEGSALILGRAQGADWRVSVQETPEGRLMVLRPAGERLPAHGVGRLVLQLRRQTAGLSAAIQRLFPSDTLGAEKHGHYLALANQGLYRLMRLVDQMDFLDRPEGDIYRAEPVDLAGLCRRLSDELEDVSRAAGWRFEYESKLTSLVTTGDDQLLRRMLLSLLSNAAKAAAAAGGRFGLRLAKRGDRAVLTVWDQGGGLPEGEMALLFSGPEEWAPGLDPDRGAGLGLPSARRVAALHGGTLMMESPPGGGFRAVVSLPIQLPEPGMTLRTPQRPYKTEHFSGILMELADVLPLSLYTLERE